MRCSIPSIVNKSLLYQFHVTSFGLNPITALASSSKQNKFLQAKNLFKTCLKGISYNFVKYIV